MSTIMQLSMAEAIESCNVKTVTPELRLVFVKMLAALKDQGLV